MIIWSCKGQPNQQWNVNDTITGVRSSLCPDTTGQGNGNGLGLGLGLGLWTCNGQTNQRWTLHQLAIDASPLLRRPS